ncbi:MAG: class I SAM-dependent methyltransferase [Actinomycetota bacterium]|nr:class I SAM-dependent methyltransferase [Actinomycetota bacterium]
MATRVTDDPNRFARRLFARLPARYDRLAEVLSLGQNSRWRQAMVDRIAAGLAVPTPASGGALTGPPPTGHPNNPSPTGAPDSPPPTGPSPTGHPNDPSPTGHPNDPPPTGAPDSPPPAGPSPTGHPNDPPPTGHPNDPSPTGAPDSPPPAGQPNDPPPADATTTGGNTPTAPPRILDVASGTAGVALQLADRLGAQVVGVDLSLDMLRQGARNVAARAPTSPAATSRETTFPTAMSPTAASREARSDAAASRRARRSEAGARDIRSRHADVPCPDTPAGGFPAASTEASAGRAGTGPGEPAPGAAVALAVGRAEQLPFPDGSFDALTFTYLLRYVADVDATMAELARVLRPGAPVACLDFMVPPNRFWRAWWWGYTRLVLPIAGALTGGPAWFRVGRFLGPNISGHYRRHPVDRIVTAWDRAGLQDVGARTMSLGGGLVMWGRRSGG